MKPTRYDKDGVATGLAQVERNGPKSACAHFVWRLAPKPVAFDGHQVHRDASEPATRHILPRRIRAVLPFAAIGDIKQPMMTISLKVDEKLAAGLEAEARARRTTRSELCRQALAGLLRRSAKGKPTLLQQSKDLCGAGSSGMRDLSSNKRHLAGFGRKPR